MSSSIPTARSKLLSANPSPDPVTPAGQERLCGLGRNHPAPATAFSSEQAGKGGTRNPMLEALSLPSESEANHWNGAKARFLCHFLLERQKKVSPMSDVPSDLGGTRGDNIRPFCSKFSQPHNGYLPYGQRGGRNRRTRLGDMTSVAPFLFSRDHPARNNGLHFCASQRASSPER